MTMPIDLVLVRHGESEGNIAVEASKKGDTSFYTDVFKNTHSSLWHLTSTGVEQAQAAGDWLRKNLGFDFDRFYSSEYIRALETAAHLGLPNAQWRPEFYLRERDWGYADVLSREEQEQLYAAAMQLRKSNKFFARLPNGESVADACLRIERILNTLHRECSDKRVVMVNHGEIMWAFRVRLERMPVFRFLELDASKHPHDKIHNCQILHYTRRDPLTGEVIPHLGWMRSVCPWDESKSSNDWQTLERKWYSNEDLFEIVGKVPRIFED